MWRFDKKLCNCWVCELKASQILVHKFRALMVKDDYVIGARGYELLSYDLQTKRLIRFSRVNDNKCALLSKSALIRRFFRAEITNLYTLKDYSLLAIAKKGLFKKSVDDCVFQKVFQIPRGSRPLGLCVTPNGNIYFGEYFQNKKRVEVNIYASKDNGETWHVVHTFPAGEINHIHNVVYDKYTGRIWVVTGDDDGECIIGYTEDEFKTFTEFMRGDQHIRCCNLLFYPERIVYATDSEHIRNKIYSIDRETKEVKELCEINGSCIYSGQTDSVAFVSSTMENSEINNDGYSRLYLSKDGKEWSEVAAYKKDWLPKTLFQFGSIQFPRYETTKECDVIVFSGRAVKQIGGNTVIMNV